METLVLVVLLELMEDLASLERLDPREEPDPRACLDPQGPSVPLEQEALQDSLDSLAPQVRRYTSLTKHPISEISPTDVSLMCICNALTRGTFQFFGCFFVHCTGKDL